MTHNQHTTTTVQVQMSGRTILDCIMHKLPSSRKYYRVTLIVPDNGVPIIEYHQTNASKKPKKSIQFVDLLFADKKHDTSEKFAFSIYTTDKTITFLAQDEATMNEWLNKIRECHSKLYPEFKRYDAVFEANLLDKGLAKTMNIQGPYRLALCKESLDLIPLLSTPNLLSEQYLSKSNTKKPSTSSSKSTATTNTTTITSMNNADSKQKQQQQQQDDEFVSPMLHNESVDSSDLNSLISSHQTTHHHHLPHHCHLPQHLPQHQRFHKRHPLLSSKTIELVLRSIRRCGHTGNNFYIESGRHSQIGEGDLWMALTKKSVARQLHELLLTTMRQASTTDEQFLYKTPRSRSGSSGENAHRSHQSRSPSLVCLNSDPATHNNSSNNNNNNNHNINIHNTTNSNNDFNEDSGYLPMA